MERGERVMIGGKIIKHGREVVSVKYEESCISPSQL